MSLILQFLISTKGNDYSFSSHTSHPLMLMKMALRKQTPKLPIVMLEPSKWLAEICIDDDTVNESHWDNSTAE